MTVAELLALHQANAKRFRSLLRDYGLSIKGFGSLEKAAEALAEAIGQGSGGNPPSTSKKVSERPTGRQRAIEVDFTPQPPTQSTPKPFLEIDFRALVRECLEEYETGEAEAQARKAPRVESPSWWPLGSLAPEIASKAAGMLKNHGFRTRVDDTHNWGYNWGRVMVYGTRTQEGKARALWYDYRQKHVH